MKATKQLSEEHKAIKLCLEILEKISNRLELRRELNPKHLKDLLTFITVFADKCHHAKEEDLLFPAMEETGIPKEGGPIGVMLAEHDMGRGYVKGMSENMTNPSKFVENARNYITLLRDHIDKEDNILYPMAERHLSGATDKTLLEGFEKIEAERISPGKHEEFHKLLENLEQVYLK